MCKNAKKLFKTQSFYVIIKAENQYNIKIFLEF